MRPSRGMGDIMPSKMGKGVKKARRDDTDFTQYAEGGWIKDAIKKPGSLKKALGVPADKKIPSSKLAAAAKKPGKVGKRARLAETLKGFKK